MEHSNDADKQNELTTFHVRQARAGDRESLEWIVKKFTPLLVADARYRLGKVLREIYDPEDVVNDVWIVALPRLPGLSARNNRHTPVLLKFLSTTLLHRISDLVKKHVRGKPKKVKESASDGAGAASPVDNLSAELTGVLTQLVHSEMRDAVSEALARLGDQERELLILRGIEQQSYKDIASIVRRDHRSLSMEYHRAVEKLRKAMPNSVFEELKD